MNEIIPKKCAIKYKPPSLVIFYEIINTGKVHRRSIPIRAPNNTINEEFINDLFNNSNHAKYLKEFKSEQVKKLLKMLNEKMNESESESKPVFNFDLSENKQNSLDLDIDATDLNKLDDFKLNEVKEVMNESFEQNRVKPGDVDWNYDIDVDFDNKNAKVESGWDENDDDDDSDMEF